MNELEGNERDGLGFVLPLPNINKMPGHCSRGSHRRANQVRSSALALAAFEVAVARARAALTRREDVGVHAQAHAAARFAPVEARLAEDLIEALLFRLRLDRAATRHNHRVESVADFVALDHCGSRAQIFDPAVGARADEDLVQHQIHHRCPGGNAHILECAGCGLAFGVVGKVIGVLGPWP